MADSSIGANRANGGSSLIFAWITGCLSRGFFVGLGGVLEPQALHPGNVVSEAVDPMLPTNQGRLAGLLARKDLLQGRAASALTDGDLQVFFGRIRNSMA